MHVPSVIRAHPLKVAHVVTVSSKHLSQEPGGGTARAALQPFWANRSFECGARTPAPLRELFYHPVASLEQGRYVKY